VKSANTSTVVAPSGAREIDAALDDAERPRRELAPHGVAAVAHPLERVLAPAHRHNAEQARVRASRQLAAASRRRRELDRRQADGLVEAIGVGEERPRLRRRDAEAARAREVERPSGHQCPSL
jgi:cytochrome c-type biogenesis protein CcmH/NrfG